MSWQTGDAFDVIERVACLQWTYFKDYKLSPPLSDAPKIAVPKEVVSNLGSIPTLL